MKKKTIVVHLDAESTELYNEFRDKNQEITTARGAVIKLLKFWKSKQKGKR